ncbi:MAG: ribonuclease D [Deltaproteobacteria bacterium]|nr:ribonuclease D [Deltaproteobacteria bacterium]
MKKDWTWIDSRSGMGQAREDLEGAAVIAIDTEYDSFRYFREKLCLIQIGTAQRLYLIDPLDPPDLSILERVFAEPGILKVLHAGDNDIRILRRDYGMRFENIFDTHRAAALLGCQRLALSTLIALYLDIDFQKNKKMQRSIWEERPLTKEQIEYALQDVAFLIDLYRTLDAEIEKKGLRAQAAHAFLMTAKAEWRERILDPRGHKRIEGYSELDETGRRRLESLYRWRFEKAKEIDRAAFMILSEKEMVCLSKLSSPALEALTEETGLARERADRFGGEIIEVLIRKP